MGVKIKKIISDARKKANIQDFYGKRIAIDAFNWLYSFLSTIRQYDGTPLMDSHGHVTSHLSGFFFRNLYLLENGIKPIYIFDGKSPELKMKTIMERIKIRENARIKAEEARERGDYEEAKKYAQASSKIEPYMIPEVKELLDLMGIPYIDAPSEAEAQAAYMAIKNEVYIVSSQDYDAFLFGAPRLLRNLTQQKKRVIRGQTYSIEMELYVLENVLNVLGITREQLIDIGILIGTDFNTGIPRVGEKTALKLIKEYGCLENIYEKKPQYEAHLPLQLAIEVRKIFLQPETTDSYEIKFKPLNAKGLVGFLCGDHDFSVERVKKQLIMLKKRTKVVKHERLDSFLK
ncbi:MAG: flap endonuclease-1 [Promethearchaeota archaeon]